MKEGKKGLKNSTTLNSRTMNGTIQSMSIEGETSFDRSEQHRFQIFQQMGVQFFDLPL